MTSTCPMMLRAATPPAPLRRQVAVMAAALLLSGGVATGWPDAPEACRSARSLAGIDDVELTDR